MSGPRGDRVRPERGMRFGERNPGRSRHSGRIPHSCVPAKGVEPLIGWHRILGGGILGTPRKEPIMNATTAPSEQLTLSIDGMSCGHCVQTVTKALSGVPGVKVRAVAVGSAEIDTSSPNAANDAVAGLDGAG